MAKIELKKGDFVAWNWAGRTIDGIVVSVHFERTEIVSKGKHIVRNGSPENPAVIIMHKNANEVLKLASELLETY